MFKKKYNLCRTTLHFLSYHAAQKTVTAVGVIMHFFQDFATSYYVKKGVPSSMINVGLGMYGRSFTLSNPGNNGLDASARGAGTAGRFTKEKGFMSYYEVNVTIEI
jgi:chitinase